MSSEAATIVVVDDAPEVRALVKARLRLSGSFDVVGEGSDGSAAVALANQHHPEVMLLDVSMPGMDGLEALPKVLDASPDTKVVLYSGFEEHGLVEEAQRLGATAFVEKSERIESLVDRLQLVISASRSDDGSDPESAPFRGLTPPENHRRHSDQAVLDEHLERFREVFDEAAIGMATITLAGRVVRANRALATLMARDAPEMVGMSYGELTNDSGELVTAALRDIRERPLDVVQLEHGVRGSRDHRLVRSTLAPVRDSQGRPLYVFLQVQDVTRERAALEELRQSEERFRLLVETVQDYAIFMLDPQGHIASWNAGAQRSKGYTADDIIGQHFRVFYPPHQQEIRHPEHELELALRDGRYEEEGWRVRKDGSQFWALVVITAVFNPAGEHIGFAKVTRDNSERRVLEQDREEAAMALAEANVELAALNERLQRAADEQAEFLAVTAHELRTPVSVLAGTAELLGRHWVELTDEERAEQLEAMETSTTRLRRLLADLLTASRLEASALELSTDDVPVSEIVHDAVSTVRRSTEGAEILVETLPDAVVHADGDRMSQAVDNLLINGLKHGRPPVRVGARVGDDQVEIRVSDAGDGVTEAMQSRLFDRFATGRRRGGTGLGLYIVRELARAQGGDAYYEPPTAEETSGVFVLRMPLAPIPEQTR
jgi:PAS domain S-box-containing protein